MLSVKLLFSVLALLFVPGLAAKCKPKRFFNLDGGYVSSPGYPNYYEKNLQCQFSFRPGPGYIVALTFISFKTQGMKDDLLTDYVRIFDGPKSAKPDPVYFYGNPVTPFTFMSKTDRVRMRFKTNFDVHKTGFRASYKFINTRTHCDVTTISKNSTNVTSCTNLTSGYASECTIQCKYGYKLIDPDKNVTRCENGKFTKSCEIDLAVMVDDCQNNGMENCPLTKDELKEFYQANPVNGSEKEKERAYLLNGELNNNGTFVRSKAGRGGPLPCHPEFCRKENKSFTLNCSLIPQFFYKYLCFYCRITVNCYKKGTTGFV